MVPAALMGLDVPYLLDAARLAAKAINPALELELQSVITQIKGATN
jgi:hypothetical protein